MSIISLCIYKCVIICVLCVEVKLMNSFAENADDFEIIVREDSDVVTYSYGNVNNLCETYTKIHARGTVWLDSLVTFKPANIPDAPVMVVDTSSRRMVVDMPVSFVPPDTHSRTRFVYLPQSVDEWEIKYYSSYFPLSSPDPKYLKNAGVVNLNEFFGEYILDWLRLDLSFGQYICPKDYPDYKYHIPSVD